MFELLSNVQSVPIDQDELTTIQRGMNKVRVSVGEHNSEPSEVYIITGLSDGKLETYIIFYILEPGIHVVYGYDQNPYAPQTREQVIEEATDFVEEMGAILEDIPLEDMSRDQRKAWFEGESLFSEPMTVDLEEIEELELVEIMDEAAEETQLLDVADLDLDEDIVEVSDEEVKQALLENGSDEDLSEPVKFDEDKDQGSVDPDRSAARSVDAAGMEDVVVADGDFDEMLKQAFLKPDVVEKTRRKAKDQEKMLEEEQLAPDDAEDDEAEDLIAEQELRAELAEIGGTMDAVNDLAATGDLEVSTTPETGPDTEKITVDHTQSLPEVKNEPDTEEESGLTVIRFLSKF